MCSLYLHITHDFLFLPSIQIQRHVLSHLRPVLHDLPNALAAPPANTSSIPYLLNLSLFHFSSQPQSYILHQIYLYKITFVFIYLFIFIVKLFNLLASKVILIHKKAKLQQTHSIKK